jgi:nucleoside-diphosphate-sugar epimerase
MVTLVTGASGFLGRRLVDALLEGVEGLPPTSAILAADVAPATVRDPRVHVRTGTLTDEGFVRDLVTADVGLVFHLAAVVSGQAEADFDLGMAVNVDGTRALLDACRTLPRPPRFVFSSTVGAFGGALPEVVPEDFPLRPDSSYGAEKAIGELLVCDYSRRGFVDGVVCRLPTVAVRPGKPNAALSSFVSGIVREPLAGIESVCPVPFDTRLWITSPDVVTANLIHAARISTAALEGRRCLNLPGLTVTAGEMLDSLERLGGPAARSRVRCEIDPRMAGIVCSWPGAFDVSRPLALGFRADENLDALVTQFISERERRK